MNWIFLGFVVFVVLGLILTVRRDLRAGRGTRQGPVPGYSVTPGSAFAEGDGLPLVRGDDWNPLSIETFHSQNRSRVILSVDTREGVEPDALHAFAEACAARIGERSRASVVFLEVFRAGRPRAFYLYAPDGRGWSGGGRLTRLFVDVPGAV